MARKKKNGDKTSFLFDEDAGSVDSIDLFGPDGEDAEEPEPEEEPYDESDGPDAPEIEDEPTEPEETDKPAGAQTFHFDRYGRRVDKKKKKERYGKRKNAPHATTVVVQHDTEAKREYDEARARADARAKKRAREEAKKAELKRAERKKRRRRSASTFLLGVLALLGLAVLTWIITRVSTIRIMNVPSGYSEERITELTGLSNKVGKRSALFISTSDVEKHIQNADPYLDASVRYSFPSTFYVTVNKREEAACVRWGPQNEYLAVIDENGTVLNAAAESTNGLLIADGMNISSAVNGARLGDSSDIQVAALIRLLTKLKEHGILERTPRINRIDMTELMQIRMYVEGASYTIEVGDTSNLETKLMLLQKHWTEIMDEAAAFIRGGRSTVTIYLYSKGGVNISPYEPGYVMPTLAPPSVGPTNSPGEGTGEQPVETPGAEPDESPDDQPYVPAATPMPHQEDPFTG